MSRPADFEKIRKNRARRRTLGRFLAVVLVTGLAFAAYTFRYEITSQGFGVLLADQLALMTQTENYPVALPDKPVELLAVGRRAAVVTESSVNVYSPVGEKKLDDRVTGQSTLADCAGSYLLTYARGGYDLSVKSGETELFSLRTEQAIHAAVVSRSGFVAVATAQAGAASCVTVYNNSYKQVFEWSLSGSTVTALALDEGGKSVAVGSVFSDEGVLTSRLRAFSVRDGEGLLEEELPDTLLLALRWQTDGSLTAVGDRGAWAFSEGDIQSAAFDGELAAFAFLSDGSVAAATGDYLTAHEVALARYSPKLEKTASAVLTQEVRSMQDSPLGLLVFTGERVLRYTPVFERAAVMETPGALQVACTGKNLYYTTVSHLCRMTLR